MLGAIQAFPPSQIFGIGGNESRAGDIIARRKAEDVAEESFR